MKNLMLRFKNSSISLFEKIKPKKKLEVILYDEKNFTSKKLIAFNRNKSHLKSVTLKISSSS